MNVYTKTPILMRVTDKMSVFWYDAGIFFYRLMITAASVFHPKARKMLEGRQNWQKKLEKSLEKRAGKRVLWFHCASVGEFEQARPLIELIKKEHQNSFIFLSFFSPSGYELRKNYEFADAVMYLPYDSKKNATILLENLQPAGVFFVKYEFWFHFLHSCRQKNIPLFLLSGIFRAEQAFFKKENRFWRKILTFFDTFFVQNQLSAELLSGAGFENFLVTGDTRFDRVREIKNGNRTNDIAEKFANGSRVFIAGSVWSEDVKLLAKMQIPCKIILAPHEISEKNLLEAEKYFPDSVRYSLVNEANEEILKQKKVLLIDNVGYLSVLYRYGKIAYIGGAFGDGLHNILEPAVFGLPVIFGKEFRKFQEATDLVEAGGAFSVRNHAEAEKILLKLLQDDSFYNNTQKIILDYLEKQYGATQKVYNFLAEKKYISY